MTIKTLLLITFFSFSISFGSNSKIFSIISEDNNAKIIKTLEKEAELILYDIQERFLFVPDSFTIILANTEEEFKENFDSSFPSWGVAAAKYSGPLIVLKSPRFSKQNLEELKSTLSHEIAHLALYPYIKGKYFPIWMNEGFAQYISKQFTLNSKILLGQQGVWNNYFNLSKIDDVLKFEHKRANLGYAQSISAFHYLIDEFGKEKFIQFIFMMKNEEFDTAFENIYGFPEDLFNLTWKKWALRHYRPYALMDINTLLWGIMPLLVIIGFIRTKINNIETYRGWEEQDYSIDNESIDNNKLN